jgi:hypothetical protein
LSLILNGGIGGSGTTQFAYLASRVASALPAIISFWHRTGIDSNSGGRVANFAQSTAAVGTYRMGSSLSRTTGPVFNNQTAVFDTTGHTSRFSTRSDLTEGRYRYPLTSITSGATTTITVDSLGDPMPYAAGMYVKPEGTFTGLSGLVSGREYRVASVSGANAVLEVATTERCRKAGPGPFDGRHGSRSGGTSVLCGSTARRTRPACSIGAGSSVRPGITIYSGTTGTTSPATIWDVLDRICFGGLYQSDTGNTPFRGELAHLAVWSGVSLDDSKAGELLTVAPNLVSWGTPLAYVPCLGDGNATIGATNLTPIGDPTYTSDGPSITLSGGGGGSGTFIPSIMRAQPTNLFGF